MKPLGYPKFCGKILSFLAASFLTATVTVAVGQQHPVIQPIDTAPEIIVPAINITAPLQSNQLRGGQLIPANCSILNGQSGAAIGAAQTGQSIATRTPLGSELVQVRGQDEIWLVSARSDDGSLACWKLQHGQWVDCSVDDVTAAHAADIEKSTIAYVHGDRTNIVYARARGLQVYKRLFNRNEMGQGKPVRFVIFAWRTERERIRASSDYRIKLDRSVHVGSTFKHFLGRFESKDMLLLGFSLGGQVILSALLEEDLSAGDSPVQRSGRYSVALITPALDPEIESTCLDAIGNNPGVCQTEVFINRRDPAIRAAKLLTRGKRFESCGQFGDEITFDRLIQWCPGVQFGSIRVDDITAEVTACHSVIKYIDQSTTMRETIIKQAYSLRSPISQAASPLKTSTALRR